MQISSCQLQQGSPTYSPRPGISPWPVRYRAPGIAGEPVAPLRGHQRPHLRMHGDASIPTSVTLMPVAHLRMPVGTSAPWVCTAHLCICVHTSTTIGCAPICACTCRAAHARIFLLLPFLPGHQAGKVGNSEPQHMLNQLFSGTLMEHSRTPLKRFQSIGEKCGVIIVWRDPRQESLGHCHADG